MAAAIALPVLEQAAEWLVRLHGGDADDATRAACALWCAADPEHQRAWDRAERLMGKLGELPPDLSRAALQGPDRARRATLGRIVAVLAVAPVAWGTWRVADNRQWTADHATAPGEQRTVTLADGTAVLLNTDSAIDVPFTATEPRIVLRQGEILVTSGPHAPRRPLRVATVHGTLEALGTRFTVHRTERDTAVAVLEGAVRIAPEAAAPLVLAAGRQSRFTQQAVAAPGPRDPAGAAWTRGMLLADAMRLDALAAELARYRRGVVRVDPAIAALAVSGAFPIRDTERTLAMLAQTYGIDVLPRMNGWWVTLAPAARKSNRT